eukprot:1721601-Heterocapsa_arctica.AAC.1
MKAFLFFKIICLPSSLVNLTAPNFARCRLCLGLVARKMARCSIFAGVVASAHNQVPAHSPIAIIVSPLSSFVLRSTIAFFLE